MRLADFVPAFAAVTCLELSFLFLALYYRVDKRSENGVFSALAFSLAGMIWCALMLQDAVDPRRDFFWYHLHYFFVYAVAATLWHFFSLVSRRMLPYPLTPLSLYLLAAVISLWGLSDRVFHQIPAGTIPDNFDNAIWGSEYPVYAAIPLLICFYACLSTLLPLRQKAITKPLPYAENVQTFIVFEREVSLIAWAALIVLVAALFEFLQQVLFTQISITLNPRALGSLCFCAATAWTLCRAMMRSKEKLQRARVERAALDDLARARLQAMYDLQHQIKNNLVAVELPLRNVLRELPESEQNARQRARISSAVEEVHLLYDSLDVLLNTARLAAGQPIPFTQPANEARSLEEL